MLTSEHVRDFVAKLIGDRLRSVTGSHGTLHDFEVPKGDAGLFGPDAMAWRVHAHFTAMMVGGLSSLMVQSLHPRALAAVWDHSDFRNKLRERLGRTAHFVAATTYGGQSMAMSAIQRVNAIHANIKGVDPSGCPYIANEPRLIRWVHLVEVTSFLSAYQHLSKQPLNEAQCNQYIREMTQIGHLLGAEDLPDTWQSTQDALVDYQGELRADERTQEILNVIQNYPVDCLDKPFMHLVLKAAWDVMPAWVLSKINRPASCALQMKTTQLALMAAAEPVQWMLDQHGVRAVSTQRVLGASPSSHAQR